MKKLVALPLAALFIAACSEPTTPNASDLTPSYAKPGSGAPPVTVTGSLFSDSYNFDGTVIADGSGTSLWGTDCDGCVASSADGNIQSVPNNITNLFLGRFPEVGTRALLVVPDAGSEVSVTFDLYVIGSWDGRGKQAQHGVFQANVFQLSYRCEGTASTSTIFQTTFSNQLTVQQDYPLSYLQGGNKAGTGAVAIDALGYASRPDLSNTPQFRSFGDATYHMSFAMANPCISVADGGITFIFSSTNPSAQSTWDESWGIDNVTVETFGGQVAETPEPGAAVLALVGLAGVIGYRRLRRLVAPA